MIPFQSFWQDFTIALATTIRTFGGIEATVTLQNQLCAINQAANILARAYCKKRTSSFANWNDDGGVELLLLAAFRMIITTRLQSHCGRMLLKRILSMRLCPYLSICHFSSLSISVYFCWIKNNMAISENLIMSKAKNKHPAINRLWTSALQNIV